MTDAEKSWDVIVIGGGPAGLSAALWCSDLGMRCVLVERESDIGGQLQTIHNPINNYIGARAQNGWEMLERFRESIDGSSFMRRLSTEVLGMDPSSGTVRLATGESVSATFVIVATGVRRRTLGIRGEREFMGRGIIESGSRDRTHLQGKRVLIVGGGDAAIENAQIVSEFAASVRVAFRKNEPTARHDLRSAIGHLPNVELLPSTVVVELHGSKALNGARLRNTVSQDEWVEAFDAVLIRIGVEPNTEILGEGVDLDERGYVKVTPVGETTQARVFAIGDVANPLAPTLATAAGTGASAVKVIRDRLSKI